MLTKVSGASQEYKDMWHLEQAFEDVGERLDALEQGAAAR
jgi:hypothetical protein